MDFIIISTLSVTSAYITHHIGSKLRMVLGSAIPTVILMILLIPLESVIIIPIYEDIPTIFFGSSFVGMSSKKRLDKKYILLVTAFLFAVLYHFLMGSFNGLGGGLGTMAFISVTTVLLLKKLFLK